MLNNKYKNAIGSRTIQPVTARNIIASPRSSHSLPPFTCNHCHTHNHIPIHTLSRWCEVSRRTKVFLCDALLASLVCQFYTSKLTQHFHRGGGARCEQSCGWAGGWAQTPENLYPPSAHYLQMHPLARSQWCFFLGEYTSECCGP